MLFDYAEKNLLNARTFRSLEHLNELARWWLGEVNDRRIHGTTKRSPLELHEEEKPHLIDLPSIRFDTAQVVYRNVDSEGLINYLDNCTSMGSFASAATAGTKLNGSCRFCMAIPRKMA